ncbi:MAG: 30S ribosomal protein S6 [Candidatus Poribacteria bacterium]|nr:30S ribosomal protein S6 [Candidatus Poribacteria bacterium]
MKPYELLLIITPDHDENEAEALTNQVKSIIENGGTLLKVDPWGKKRLAYPIRKRSEGYYVLYIFESAPSFVAELNQSLHVIEAILRYMVVQYEDDIEKLKAEFASKTVEDKESTPDEEPASDEGSTPSEDSTSDDDTATEDTTDDDAEAEGTTESA